MEQRSKNNRKGRIRRSQEKKTGVRERLQGRTGDKRKDRKRTEVRGNMEN